MSGNKFMFTTGIENSYPTIPLADGSTKRVDEMEKTDHYNRWEEDFSLLQELGQNFLDTVHRTTRCISAQTDMIGSLLM